MLAVVLAVVLLAMVLLVVMVLLVMLLVVLASMAVAMVRRWGRNRFLRLLSRLVQVAIGPKDNLKTIVLLLALQVKTPRAFLGAVIIVTIIVILRHILSNVGPDLKSRGINKETGSNNNIRKDIALSNRQLDVTNISRDG